MAKKKTAARKPDIRRAIGSVTNDGVKLDLHRLQSDALQNCLDTNGSASIQIEEIETSELPNVLRLGVNID